MQKLPHLTADRRLITKGGRRQLKDARKLESAAAALPQLPAEDETIHLVISGKFALWHLVPVAAAIATGPIERLHLATLGFSRDNIDALCGMLDAGTVRRVRLLCSHYFKSTSADLYNHAAQQLARRADRAEFFSIRTHAKLLLLRWKDGRTLTVESSANLRSCHNVEQMTPCGDPAVYQFHAAWIDELFSRGSTLPRG